jgi:tyrosinase
MAGRTARTKRKTARRKQARAATSPQRVQAVGSPRRPRTAAKTFTSRSIPVDFASPRHRLSRADLEISGIYHGESSYEGRIFLNNPKATAQTPKTARSGYAGSFHIFGHGGCLGDPGHCEVNEHNRQAYDYRYPHPLTPARKRVNVTKALQEAARRGKTVTVTVVPVVTAANRLCDTVNVFRCENMQFVTYN